MSRVLRRWVTAGSALVGAGIVVVVVNPAAPAPPDVQVRAVRLASGELVGLIVGGSGTPIPQLNDDWIADTNALYIQRILPGAIPQGVFTPEGLSPIYSGVKSLPLDTSVAEGTFMLDTYIRDDVVAGDTVAVSGSSQSSTIAGFVMNDLEAQGVAAVSVKFVLVGDPSNPDGGLLERFAGLSIPSLGITFSGATPPNTIYETWIYTQEYDGFADFPKYPINFLSDLNAFLGIEDVHPTYRSLTTDELNGAIVLPTTPGYEGHTTYYMIPLDTLQYPNNYLPLLRPLLHIPFVGKPLADLLQPDLAQIVNLGYDNSTNEGWDVGQANVPTQFGLFPSPGQVLTAIKNLGPGTQQGVGDAMHDIGTGGLSADPPSQLAGLLAGGGTSPLDISPVDVIDKLTAAFASSYSILLPTADIATAIAITMPTYDASLFVGNLANPFDAIGFPVAADTALLTLAGGIEFMVIDETLHDIIAGL